jgi:hypothetical protein
MSAMRKSEQNTATRTWEDKVLPGQTYLVIGRGEGAQWRFSLETTDPTRRYDFNDLAEMIAFLQDHVADSTAKEVLYRVEATADES